MCMLLVISQDKGGGKKNLTLWTQKETIFEGLGNKIISKYLLQIKTQKKKNTAGKVCKIYARSTYLSWSDISIRNQKIYNIHPSLKVENNFNFKHIWGIWKIDVRLFYLWRESNSWCAFKIEAGSQFTLSRTARLNVTIFHLNALLSFNCHRTF